MDTQDPSVASQPRDKRLFVDRAHRSELRTPIRFRRAGTQDWQMGETINLSESGLLFTSNELLEVDTRLEITFVS